MKIKEINEERIIFDNGTQITFYHNQDCCENVYCDFKALIDTNIKDIEFESIDIEPIEDSGFRLNGFFVPCYNEQNGYYSDDLELVITYNAIKEEKYDLREMNCIEDQIY